MEGLKGAKAGSAFRELVCWRWRAGTRILQILQDLQSREHPAALLLRGAPWANLARRARSPHPQALAARTKCSEVAGAPMDPAFILFPLPVWIS